MGRVTIEYGTETGDTGDMGDGAVASEVVGELPALEHRTRAPKLKIKRKRGRPRISGQDPNELLILKPTKVPHDRKLPSTAVVIRDDQPSPLEGMPLSGTDHYLDHDYLAAERRKRYRAEDFHVATVNEFDHTSEKVTIRTHPNMLRAMQEMVDCREFAIRNVQAIFLVGGLELMRRLYYIRNGMTEEERDARRTSNPIVVLESIARIHANAQEMLDFQNRILTLRRQVRAHLRLGEHGARLAAKLIVAVKHEVKKMESSEWRDWYYEQIDSEFGPMVEKQQKRVKVLRGEQRHHHG